MEVGVLVTSSTFDLSIAGTAAVAGLGLRRDSFVLQGEGWREQLDQKHIVVRFPRVLSPHCYV